MEDNFQQTQETPVSTAEPVKKSGSKSTLVIVVLLVLIFVVLGALVAYQVMSGKGISLNPDQRDYTEESTVTETEPDVEEEEAETGTTGQTVTETDTTDTNKPDIDKDLENLDELDLSDIENDYAEDQLGDF